MTTMSRSYREANVWFQRMGVPPNFASRGRIGGTEHVPAVSSDRRGTPAEQWRRDAAAQEKRARKAMRQHRNALKDGTEFRA